LRSRRSDPAFGFEPGVVCSIGQRWRALKSRVGLAFASAPDRRCGGSGGDRVAGATASADLGIDPALEQALFERVAVVAAVGPHLPGA
jgi:hypothetical protein